MMLSYKVLFSIFCLLLLPQGYAAEDESCVDITVTFSYGHAPNGASWAIQNTDCFAPVGQYELDITDEWYFYVYEEHDGDKEDTECCIIPGEYTLECGSEDGNGWKGGHLEINGEAYCQGYNYYSQEHTIYLDVEEFDPYANVYEMVENVYCAGISRLTGSNGYQIWTTTLKQCQTQCDLRDDCSGCAYSCGIHGYSLFSACGEETDHWDSSCGSVVHYKTINELIRPSQAPTTFLPTTAQPSHAPTTSEPSHAPTTPAPTVSFEETFQDMGVGKCTVNDGEDPIHEYLGGVDDCEGSCLADAECWGYSDSGANCLLWHEGPLDDVPGPSWGTAHCHIRDMGNTELDCSMCINMAKKKLGCERVLELAENGIPSGMLQKIENAGCSPCVDSVVAECTAETGRRILTARSAQLKTRKL